MNTTTDPKKNAIQFEGVSDEILRETSPRLTPDERELLRKERETEGMLEFYGGARLNSMVSYLKSNSINKIRSKEIYLDLEVDLISPMEGQPRVFFDRGALDDLKASIAEKGLSTPILVRRVGERFFIIAGERRWRAFKELGRKKIPAIIKDIKDDKEAYIVAAIENLQREDLNVIEEALCFQKMIDSGAVTSQKELATIVGRNKSKISERLSLLKLPDGVKRMLAQKGAYLTEGHAVELLRLKDDARITEMAERAVKEKLQRDVLRKEISRMINPHKADIQPPEVTVDFVPEFVPEFAMELPEIELSMETDLKLEPLSGTAKPAPRIVPPAELPRLAPVAAAPGFEPPWNVRFTTFPDQGFDLMYRFRPAIRRDEDLKEIIDDMNKRLKAFKKLRRDLRRQGLTC